GPSGNMYTGRQTVDGKEYQFGSDGAIVLGWHLKDGAWYYLKEDMTYATGFLDIGGTRYYLEKDGKMATGWAYIDKTWYFFDASGAMRRGWLWLGGTWYFMDEDGKMATGWRTVEGKAYYFGPSGNMYTGRQTVDGKEYQFDSSGALLSYSGWNYSNNKWSYFINGKIVTGWNAIGGYWYYFDKSTGVMQKGWLIDGVSKYYLNLSTDSFGPEGAMTIGYRQIEGDWYYFNKSQWPVGALSYTGVTPITGKSLISDKKEEVVDKLVKMYIKQGGTYPSDVLQKGGASNITEFCDILYDEAVVEGIKPEVVFGQAMNETAYLQYGGDVKPEQFNFAGLGATGGVPGNSYKDVRTGLRAQVQHLKAYASDEALKTECVDDRFKYVTRKSAPYVEWLGIQENPIGKGWAAGSQYGINLMNRYIMPIYLL
ncbi:glucosaminidase domain-containing protein, partial [[Clostridium] scindens]